MSLLTKFIDSLTIRFHRATYWEVTQPIEISSAIENHNYIILLDHGHMVAGKEGIWSDRIPFIFFLPANPLSPNMVWESRNV
ncbi:MAG: hypothetical protein ACKOA1_12345 [Bacteroidota bacterium]